MNAAHALRAGIEQPEADVHRACEASTVTLEGDGMSAKVTPPRRKDRKGAPARSARDPAAAWLVAPQLTGRLRRFLGSRGIPEGEIDELIDVARMQVYEQGLPRTAIEVERLLFRIVRCRAMDWFREAQPAQKELDGFVLETVRLRAGKDPARISPEARKWLAYLKRLSKGDPKHACAFEAIRQKMAGKSFERFAAEKEVRPGTLRQWVKRFRAYAQVQVDLAISQPWRARL